MDAIGGYFSLELPRHEEYHKEAIRLNTGRNCLEYILRCRQYKKVYLPYYTCEVILEPFKKTGTEYAFYHIDQNFELAEEISLKQGESLLYTNYFGLKQRYVEKLASRYGQQLIIDNTQAFFAMPIGGIDTFYTCRKFFGVADGAYLYIDKLLDEEFGQDKSFKRMAHLLKRIDLSAEEGFADFRNADNSLDSQPIKHMSNLTERLMQSIDYDAVARQRRNNYMQQNSSLGTTNQLDLPMDWDAVPMVYPYLTDKKNPRDYLIKNKVFVARYWPNVMEWAGEGTIEKYLSFHLLPLPIDQRYCEDNMKRIIELIHVYNTEN